MPRAVQLVLRWIAYLVLIAIVPAFFQGFAATVGEAGPWWIWIFVYLFFGWWLVLSATYGIALICPSRKYPNLVALGIFLFGEISYIYFRGAGGSALEVILRLGTDLQIVTALLAAAFGPPPSEFGR